MCGEMRLRRRERIMRLKLNRRRGTGDRGSHRIDIVLIDGDGAFRILMLHHGGVKFLHLVLGLAAVG
jgi:hypothetical protein